MTEFDLTHAKMRPRVFIWVASLALVVSAVTIVSSQHSHEAGPSYSRGLIDSSSRSQDLGGGALTQLTSDDVTSTSNASLASYSAIRSTGEHQSSSPPIESHALLSVKRSIPLHISIPIIGVSAPLVILGLNKDGSPQVPTSWYIPGWYKYDATPGQIGTAVILGHIDSVAGPAVFYRLRQLKDGNRVIVKLRDGQTVQFAVIAIREYLKANFPDRYVYEPRHYAALQLVTCGGAFDYQTHHYLSSIVVFTKLVKR